MLNNLLNKLENLVCPELWDDEHQVPLNLAKALVEHFPHTHYERYGKPVFWISKKQNVIISIQFDADSQEYHLTFRNYSTMKSDGMKYSFYSTNIAMFCYITDGLYKKYLPS